jgi:NAD(P)-dependent dehydrogenase (short-subunit alcohol dehydrogenase family)
MSTARVAVVTGGATGVGRGMANAFARRDFRLVLAGVDAGRLDRAVDELRAAGAEAIGVPTDVRDAAAVDALAAAAQEAFGRIDVACNNAGVWTMETQWETPLDEWKWAVDVNLWGVVHGIRSFVPILLDNPDGGRIVNTASMVGLFGLPFSGPYTTTKHAVVGLSKGLRQELDARSGGRVGVTVACPGPVKTSIVDNLARRPDGNSDRASDVQVIYDAITQQVSEGINADEAGEVIVDAVERGRFWAFPGAAALMPIVRQDADELVASFVRVHNTNHDALLGAPGE